MVIIVKAPLKTKDIQTLLDGYEKDGVTFRFSAWAGTNMEFVVEGADAPRAIAMAKDVIKGTDFGRVLYFSIVEK